jgi:epoxyqueuosine reductase
MSLAWGASQDRLTVVLARAEPLRHGGRALTPAKERICEEARRLGFDAVGVARADVPLEADYEHYEAFVREGMQGEMGWLADFPEARRRIDGEHVLAGARSVICLARRYARTPDEERGDPPTAKAIARYARGRDYHNGVRKKLRRLAALVRSLGNGERVDARPLCDTEPVLERAWAARAGLGFVGKNGLLIVPGTGSFVLLGEVVTTLELEPDPPIPERCGACTRCLEACPTEAFVRPFVLDPRRCVAYLTIEHRSSIPESLRPGVADHLFGCDDCQTACPFNAGARRAALPLDPRFLPDPRWGDVAVADLLELDDQGFAHLREGSAVGRATRLGLARNAAVVLGNAGDPRALPALEHARLAHEEEIVREAAAWAIARITGTGSS